MAKPSLPTTSKGVNPEFFKIYFPNQSFKQMIIPSAFVKYMDEKLHQNYTLVSPENSAWSVTLKEENGSLFFHEGWNNFVEENSLEFGDILIFTYLGADQFSFKVYGKHCCLKNDTLMNTINLKDDEPQMHQGFAKSSREYLEVIDDDDEPIESESESDFESESESEREFSKHGKCKNPAPKLLSYPTGWI
ncbi:putative B3 domain-containing protein At5g66980 isoform X2 [Impatiens glandulifera]|uniref:putative B3 domain-containing protein At5g66980 isoform X2 n=1 Tax=Impatiens glandulifera TaxID=253017 RepID=UPI001FB0AF2D|nr:putative B3 domain-containing protein At5g66980 isoform X2 [Impatiens glandulifera]